MKKVLYILLAASAALILSCSKENEQPTPAAPEKTGKTITFTASMDIPFETRAALSSLNINWSNGDYVGIATDNNATIVAYPVSNISGNTCEITVDAVDGANAYYAIFRGSNATYAANDFTGVSFNTETKTFSGLTVGDTQYSAGEFNSHLYISNGYPLTMAGKSTGSTLVMKPCLALFKMRIDAASVPAEYYYKTITYHSSYGVDHPHNYSAVRGFRFYQKGASTIYSSGNFTVQVAADGSLTTSVDDASKTESREVSLENKMVAGTDYYMCLIPGGSTSSFLIKFLGFTDANDGTISWGDAYSMSLSGNRTVAPGDFYDLGTLNPLGRKMAKNEADDEIEDASAVFVPSFTIDGDFDDWDGVTEYDGTRPGGGSNSRIAAWRMAADKYNIFIYMKIVTEKLIGYPDRYIYIGFDTDNNTSTGTTRGGILGCEKYAVLYPAQAGTNPVEFITGADPRSTVNGSSDGTLTLWGVYDNPTPASSTYSYVELCIPRSKVDLSSAGTISIGVSYNDYSTVNQSITLE